MDKKFSPGTEWIYLKIYISKSYIDKLLVTEINQVIKKLIDGKIITKFFFIRYADPHPHLRIRLLSNDPSNNNSIIVAFERKLKKLLINDIIWKIQIDTYFPELDRYNDKLLELTESLFFIDSLYSLKIIKYIKENCSEDYRWMICFKSIDSYLNNFTDKNDLDSKIIFMDELSLAFRHDFGFDEYNAKILNEIYRDKRNVIESILYNTSDHHIIKLQKIIEQRDKELLQINQQMKKICEKYEINRNGLLASYIHMNINRLIPAKNKIHELLLYDFLKRTYVSRRAKYNFQVN